MTLLEPATVVYRDGISHASHSHSARTIYKRTGCLRAFLCAYCSLATIILPNLFSSPNCFIDATIKKTKRRFELIARPFGSSPDRWLDYSLERLLDHSLDRLLDHSARSFA